MRLRCRGEGGAKDPDLVPAHIALARFYFRLEKKTDAERENPSTTLFEKPWMRWIVVKLESPVLERVLYIFTLKFNREWKSWGVLAASVNTMKISDAEATHMPSLAGDILSLY